MVSGTCKVDNLYALVTDRPPYSLGHPERRLSLAPLTYALFGASILLRQQ